MEKHLWIWKGNRDLQVLLRLKRIPDKPCTKAERILEFYRVLWCLSVPDFDYNNPVPKRYSGCNIEPYSLI